MPTFGITGSSLLGSQQKKTVSQSSNLVNVTIPARTTNQTVFVELGNKPAKTNIVRDGYAVPSIRPDDNRLDVLLSGLKIILPTKTPRVLDQAIAPGTRVSVCTEVDLILAPRSDINIGIFDNIHVDAAQSNIDEILEKVKDQKQLQDLVLKYDKADDVIDSDRVILGNLIGEFTGLEISEDKPGQGFGNAYNTMRTVYAFT